VARAAQRPTPSSVIVVELGDPEVVPFGTQTLRQWNVADFVAKANGRRASKFYAPLRSAPSNLTASAVAGAELFFGHRQVSWILDGQPEAGYRLYVDADGDGEMQDTERTQLEPIGDGSHHQAMIRGDEIKRLLD
jgi:hypothetical protein